MHLLPTRLVGPLLIEPVVHADERGFFVETYRQSALAELGLNQNIVQQNHSRSRCGVIRGMHFQPGMGKLVRCARGAIFDVVVDIRRGAPTYGSWEGIELNDSNHYQLWCPEGFAHGFCVISDVADVIYGCTTYWDPHQEGGFRYDDPDVNIRWPKQSGQTVSAKDASAPRLADIAESLPFRFQADTLTA